MKLTLRAKILGLSLIPLSAFVVAAGALIINELKNYREAHALGDNAELVHATSRFVHELQIERGRSSMFVGGKITAEQLGEQRQRVDAEVAKYREALAKAYLSVEKVAKAENLLAILASARQVADSRAELPEVVGSFSKAVQGLIEFQVIASQEQSFNGLDSLLLNLTGLEVSKESVGKLRATGAGTLGHGRPLTDLEQQSLLGLKSAVSISLNAPNLIISREGKQGIESFFASEGWMHVSETVSVILGSAHIGKYDRNPEEYFKHATVAIDQLNGILTAEFAKVQAQIGDAEQGAVKRLMVIAFALVSVSIVLVVFAVRMGFLLSSSLNELASRLKRSTDSLETASIHIADSSSQLSEGGSSQASAVQQTVSAVSQVGATVAKNAESARSGQVLSESGRQAAERGAHVVEEMIQSIQEIDRSNAEMKKEIENGNQEIAGIAKLIAEIGEKTKVINDIVFQTKLLSFNASVEAARAGEQGKGFAVVAEEVGNLAQMSGSAAREIAAMLESSTRKVDEIINKTRSRVDALARTGQEKVAVGVQHANLCGEVISEIRNNVQDLNEMVGQIARASSEQSTAVGEISRAIEQLDAVAHQNSSVAQASAEVAEQLRGETHSVHDIVGELLTIVKGDEATKTAA